MEGKIAQLTLPVLSQTKALAFYTESVGFEKKSDVALPGGGRWVTVGPKGHDVEIALWEVGSATDPEQRAWSKHWGPGKSPPIVLRVADVAAIHRDLSARGVAFPQPPKEYPWGVAATFSDPDGNLFSLSEPPRAWPKR